MQIDVNSQTMTPDAVNEAGDADFEQKVLQRSQEVPVLVDFWAPWCGPCKVIGPVLEKLATQPPWEGRFELVKVNMDESPMLAQALQIQSIPAVKLFINGGISDEFMGALPEPQIVSFLERNLPSEQVGDAVSGMRMLQQGDTSGALAIFQQVLSDEPKNPIALIGMGHILLDEERVAEALEMAAAVNEAELDKLPERAQMERLLGALRGRALLITQARADVSASNKTGSKLSQGCQLALQGDFEAALEILIGIVRTDRAYEDDAGRKAMLAVFDMLPAGHELVRDYRAKLSNLLFS